MYEGYVPDTHALVWYFLGEKSLSSRARSIIDASFARQTRLCIPTIVLLEVFHLSLKDPEKFVFPRFLEELRRAAHRIIALDNQLLNQCYKISDEITIHDRVIVATAMMLGCKVITKDKVIIETVPDCVEW